MTTATFSAAPTNAADADFRAWGSAMRTALTAVGLVRTTDTGQVDWTTATKPASGNTYPGYEIWRLNDALQSTYPLFLKLEYGAGSSAANPQIRCQIGKGSNGSGSLTTPIGVQFTSFTPSSASATNWYVCSGDGSALAVVMAPAVATGSNYGYLLIERSRDTSGNATGVGVIGVGGGGTGALARNYASGGGLVVVPTAWPATPPSPPNNPASTLTAGGGAPMFQALVADGAGNYWQPRVALTYLQLDAAALASVAIPGFGTYLPMGPGVPALCSHPSGTYGCGAIVWS